MNNGIDFSKPTPGPGLKGSGDQQLGKSDNRANNRRGNLATFPSSMRENSSFQNGVSKNNDVNRKEMDVDGSLNEISNGTADSKIPIDIRNIWCPCPGCTHSKLRGYRRLYFVRDVKTQHQKVLRGRARNSDETTW